MTEETVNRPPKQHTHLPVIAMLCLFGLVLLFCVILFMRDPIGSGNAPPIPMEKADTGVHTAAMIDPNREVRGIWIPTVLNITYPTKQGLTVPEMKAELDAIVKTARENRLNTVCFQVRPSADALYDSDIFPTSLYLTGEQGGALPDGFDPLLYLCEIAQSTDEDEALAVYAWVNPLRVTSAGQDISVLSEENPAALHPEWTLTYHNAVYFDAGIPEVRELIAAGVREICENYPVAGIIFDDYFYPYPTTGTDGRILPVDDADTYAAYGTGYESVADFRRASVNEMVRMCYETVKSVNTYLQFGVAPFGIWQNANGQNGGSTTGGMESYSAIYCDPIAWMRGGYIDFIAPQIYWQFTTTVARFDTLVRWWNAQCDAYGTPLWISHAIYNYEAWNNPGEMRNQVVFARAENKYRGSLFYGYPQLRDNTLGLCEELRGVYANEIVYFSSGKTDTVPAPDIHITMPAHNSRFDDTGTFIMGQSDPHTPLFCDGIPVSRTKGGYFVLYKPLDMGENTFVFTQGETAQNFTVWRGQYAPQPELPPEKEPETESAIQTEPILPPLSASLMTPTSLTAIGADEGLTVRVRANAGATVTAALDRTSVVLTEGAAGEDGMSVYEGTLPLPACEIGAIIACGTLSVRVEKEGEPEPIVLSGAPVYALGSGAMLPVTVTEDGTELKIAPDSWYYDDYIPQSVGMTVSASSIRSGYARIALAGNTAYLAADGIAVTDTAPGMTTIGAPDIRVADGETYLTFSANGAPPVNCVKNGETFSVTVYRATADGVPDTAFTLPENPLFRDCTVRQGGSEEDAYVTYTFSLYERDRFYGFRVVYADGKLEVICRNPSPIDLSDAQPLAGKTIVLDAGHGGVDTGALTPGSHLSMSESDCNLAIVQKTAELLRGLGANVTLLRDDDTTLDIYTRMAEIDAIAPDLLLSIHQNSMPQNTDISHIRGVVGLYWTESGRSLADCVSEALSVSLGRLKRSTASQRLAMLRNYKFPAALIEVGFVTCPEEFETLVSHGGIETAARAICNGILSWYDTQADPT